MPRLVAALLALLSLSGCGEPACPEGSTALEGRCVALDADAAGLDAARVDDAGQPPDAHSPPDAAFDAGPCSRCTTALPACFEDRCVECATQADCTDDDRPFCSDGHECVGCRDRDDCGSTTPACVDTTCRACDGTVPQDCNTAAASRCDVASHSCAPCTGGAASPDCAHLAGALHCNAGTCVACLDNSHCASTEACDTSSHQCVPSTANSVARCGTCRRDTECMAGMLCVPMTYDDPRTTGDDLIPAGLHCLQREPTVTGGDCINAVPYVAAQSLTSIDDVTDIFCALRVSTCEAEAAYDATNCMTLDVAGDARCGQPGLDDGVCRMRSATTNRCTTFCIGDDDCRTGRTCNTAATPPVCRF